MKNQNSRLILSNFNGKQLKSTKKNSEIFGTEGIFFFISFSLFLSFFFSLVKSRKYNVKLPY